MITSSSLGLLIHQCSKTKSFLRGLSLHAAVIKTGTNSDLIISNHILNMYAKCGHINTAHQLFDQMSQRNLVSWSAIISGFGQSNKPHIALHLFTLMPLLPNDYILSTVICSCATLLDLRLGQQFHAHSLKLSYSSVSFVSNSLISLYMKCGMCNDALLVFNTTIYEPNCVSYNVVVNGLVENNKGDKGFQLFKVMCQRGLIPDRFTFVGLLGICSTLDDLKRGMQLHCQIIKRELDSTAFIGNVIVTMYSKFNMMEETEKSFRLIEGKDVISWNTFVAACSRCDEHAKGLSVFKEMVEENRVTPDEFTLASVLAACAGIVSVYQGRQIHGHLVKTRLDEDVVVGNALVNMYAKCGCIGYAHAVFDLMGYRNLVSWNSIIAGFANHGLGREVIELFQQMEEMGLKPDSVTFTGLLTACNHAGLVDLGKDYFKSMDSIYGVAPEVEHLSCLIDLLGRAGRLKEAEEYIEKFPFGHDPVVLGCLLSACRLLGDVVIGERLARRLLTLQPVTTSPFVLLSNLYASDRMWDGVAESRLMLKGSGLKKEPGHSLIEVKGIVEKFTIGDFSHSRIEEIAYTLKTLSWPGDEVLLI